MVEWFFPLFLLSSIHNSDPVELAEDGGWAAMPQRGGSERGGRLLAGGAALQWDTGTTGLKAEKEGTFGFHNTYFALKILIVGVFYY